MPAKILNSNNPRVKEYLANIGEVAVTFNFLESQVEFWIHHLINPTHSHAGLSQRLGKRITVSLDFFQKINLLLSLVIERNGRENGTKFKEIYNRLLKAAKNRNDIVHSQWFLEYGNTREGILSSTHKINEQKGLKFNKEANFEQANKNVTLDDLQVLVSEMLQLISDLVFFF